MKINNKKIKIIKYIKQNMFGIFKSKKKQTKITKEESKARIDEGKINN